MNAFGIWGSGGSPSKVNLQKDENVPWDSWEKRNSRSEFWKICLHFLAWAAKGKTAFQTGCLKCGNMAL